MNGGDDSSMQEEPKAKVAKRVRLLQKKAQLFVQDTYKLMQEAQTQA